ncbi:MAG: hypothetical protein WCK98_06730 [bacterium]
MSDSDAGFLGQYLTQVNQTLSQEENGHHLHDLIAPLRNLFLNQKELMSFSLCRHFGGSNELAFFSEWFYQSQKLYQDSTDLFEENQNYFRKKLPLSLKDAPGINEAIDKDIENIFLPKQLRILQQKTQELIEVLIRLEPNLERYLNKTFLSSFDSGDVVSSKKLYQENLTVSQYFDAQGTRLSFAYIGFPALLAMVFYFYKQGSKLNPKSTKWSLIEETLKNIAALHQTGSSKDLEKFVYYSRLEVDQKSEWWRLDSAQQLQKSAASTDVRQIIINLRDKVYRSCLNNLDYVVIPDRYKELINDLVQWVYRV